MWGGGSSSGGTRPLLLGQPHFLRPELPITNMDRLTTSLAPEVPANFASKGYKSRSRGQEAELFLSFSLGDLWDSFKEKSVYGLGVQLMLNEEHLVQYYVPSLSAIQLYVDPGKNRPNVRSAGGNGHRRGKLVFEHMEQERPYDRLPLTEKVSALTTNFRGLMNYRSSDLHFKSWMSIAWYPIYRIPMGQTMKDLDAAFLTFHSLSTDHSFGGPWSHIFCGSDSDPKIRLPVFGLASYKLRDSMLSPSSPWEIQQEHSLFQQADSWIRDLQVNHPDFQFFSRNRIN